MIRFTLFIFFTGILPLRCLRFFLLPLLLWSSLALSNDLPRVLA